MNQNKKSKDTTKEYIRKYGLRQYVKKKLHRELTNKDIEHYQAKYNDYIHIERATARWQYRFDIRYKNEKTEKITEYPDIYSMAYTKRNKKQAINDVIFDKARYGEIPISIKQTLVHRVYHETKPEETPEKTIKAAKPIKKVKKPKKTTKPIRKAKKPIKEETIQQKRNSTAIAMKKAGATWKDIAESLMVM